MRKCNEHPNARHRVFAELLGSDLVSKSFLDAGHQHQQVERVQCKSAADELEVVGKIHTGELEVHLEDFTYGGSDLFALRGHEGGMVAAAGQYELRMFISRSHHLRGQ